MKHLQVTGRPDPESAPPVFRIVFDSPAIRELRALDWNLADRDATTLLYAVDGNPNRFRDAARDTEGVESVALSAVEASTSYALVQARRTAVPLFATITEAMARSGLVVRKPVVYRDRDVTAHVVGDPAPLQAALETATADMTVSVDEIGQFPCARAEPDGDLSDRQREAVAAALELGYYDDPRTATQADVAAELDCAPSTASDHLRKAEAKLVGAALDEFGPEV